MQIDRAALRASWHSWVSQDDRPRAGPWWLQWVWTTVFALALAVAFTVLGFFAYGGGSGAWRNVSGWLYWYGKNAVVCLTIAYLIHILFDIGRQLVAGPARVRRWRPWVRTVYFTGLPLVGVAIGWPLGVTLAGADLVVWINRPNGTNTLVGSLLISVMLAFLFHHWFASKNRQIEAERCATEAQLMLLQSQIEPHFLFNTLANVQSLMDHDPVRAKQMLAAFTEYLRSSLSSMRAAELPLAQELDLARHYLELLQGRMDDRLRFSIDADESARGQALPPLLLQPLVENAVVHGLEPQVQGGSVHLRARVRGEQLVLEVQDDGRGLDAPARSTGRRGAGMALQNVRERLRNRYGAAATFELHAAHPGTLARITLPLQARTAQAEAGPGTRAKAGAAA
jgi:two-component sensor histidine kinase